MKSNEQFNSGKAGVKSEDFGSHPKGEVTRPESDGDKGPKGEPGPGVAKNSLAKGVKHLKKVHSAQHHMVKKHRVR